LPDYIGTAHDSIDFRIWLGSITDKGDQEIQQIFATLSNELQPNKVPDFSRTEVYAKNAGKFPIVGIIAAVVITNQPEWFIAEAKVFRIRGKLLRIPGKKPAGKQSRQ
jgi:hypothetical protein